MRAPAGMLARPTATCSGRWVPVKSAHPSGAGPRDISYEGACNSLSMPQSRLMRRSFKDGAGSYKLSYNVRIGQGWASGIRGGATGRIRTDNLPLTKRLLCH
jgi:hypothetical protein